jgi:hypothetical protein
MKMVKLNNVMGGTCSTHGRDEKMHTAVWSETLERRDHTGDLGIDERIILNGS